MIAEFTVVPLDRGAHLSKWVAPILGIVSDSGVSYQFTAMVTILEGDWDEVMGVIKACRDALLEASGRVSLSIKIDDRKGTRDRLAHKVESARRKMRI